jgi:creatinine amidohydrolase/Fe(II)-dependent formamide hydrolase-like protein
MRRAFLALVVVLSSVPLWAQQSPARPPSAGGGQCADNKYNCPETPNPLPKANTVWLEEMTWMDVRDAMKAGTDTIIIATGGIEPNGPWLALGKHQYVLRANCDAIARKLGNALCAPLVPFVPEGRLEPPSGHMTTAGTISLTEETFAALLTDIVRSFKVHGFAHIVLLGDSGGNQRGMRAVAERFTKEWNGSPKVVHIAEYYDYEGAIKHFESTGALPPGRKADGLHDEPVITANMLMTDPQSVRWQSRAKAGLATIDGYSIADLEKARAFGAQVVEFRAALTVNAIKKALGR